jgi:ketosteroid isomerase-like protein
VVSQQNVEIVRNAFRTFSAEGIDAALSFYSPDVVCYTIERWLDDSAYRGHDGPNDATRADLFATKIVPPRRR